MPVPVIIPVLSAIGRVVLTKGSQSAIKKYGREAVKKAQEEIRKRESLITKKAKEATKDVDKSKSYDEGRRLEGVLRSQRGQRLKKEWNKQRDEADIFNEPLAEKPLQLAEGGALLVPPEQEGIPTDTYTPNEQENAEANQLPDTKMEEEYLDFILDEALDDDEEDYLMSALEADQRLDDIFEKVVETASEFSGEGEVKGPGTGVSDSIPARLSDGEFVITKKATDQIGANNLQSIMDEAERAYDGGLQIYALGGTAEYDEDEKSLLGKKDEEEIKKQMITANRMPSVI